jgi:hypothetical protein
MSEKSPFDFVKSLHRHENIMEDGDEYNAYIVNKALAYHIQDLFIANELNKMSYVDDDVQYAILLNMIRPGRRQFVPWLKRELLDDDRLDAISEYYGYSRDKAKAALSILSGDDIDNIKKKLEKGGKA